MRLLTGVTLTMSPELLGAESDYYLSLEQPYRAKNAPFVSPFELLLVKGITRDIFYGDPDLGIPPLTELVTAYSATPNIDERGLAASEHQHCHAGATSGGTGRHFDGAGD
jgi:hypothetical protein